MIIEGIDWFVFGKIKEYLESKLAAGQKLEIHDEENNRTTDMWDHMEYWGEIKITISDIATGHKIHTETVRSTTTRSYTADRETQYSYKIDVSVFDAWFATPQ